MLNFNINYEDLYDTTGLEKIHSLFLDNLKTKNIDLYKFFITNSKKNYKFSDDYSTDLIQSVEIAQHLEDFILNLFNISEPYKKLQNQLIEKSKLFLFRNIFLNKKIKFVTQEELSNINFLEVKEKLYEHLNINQYDEHILVSNALKWLENQDKFQEELEVLKYFGACIFFIPNIAKEFPDQKAFFRAKKTNFDNLLNVNKENNIYKKKEEDNYLIRTDFNYYNDNEDSILNLQESNYCVKCHKRGKDTCKTGIKNNLSNEFQTNPLHNKLEGCPLNMHISQMHILNENHNLIAALVMITINNPLVAATGNSICVDCETSCIFQKQQAVQTPMVETSILNNILNLPWGFEIYSLLTKWNPLRFYRILPKKNTSKNVLIAGLGPAGFSAAYNMAMEGHNSIAIDMVNIEPLSNNLIKKPIKYLEILSTPLENRKNLGFGGVAEYGITSRWNKNYLQIIQLILAKQKNIAMYGNIRLGSSISIKECVDVLKFDHIILCNGSGKPNILNINNSLCKGIKTASEFLMVLHSGAFKNNSNVHMQIRLPIVILGAGLTAVDAATEALLYYKRMLLKYIPNYLNAVKTNSHITFINNLSEENKIILNEYLNHYSLLKNAKNNKEEIEILQNLGGCRIVYYKDILKSNAYKLNYKELQKAIDQGVLFQENSNISKINVDKYNYLSSIEFIDNTLLKARTLILALGTHPNDIVLSESNNVFDNNLLKSINKFNFNYKGKKTSSYLSKYNNVYISYLGDMHEVFSGSVVKAIASAFYSINSINKMLRTRTSSISFDELKTIFDNFSNTVLEEIEEIAKNLYKLKFKNKNFAEKCLPGNIFKLQQSVSISNISTGIFNKPTFLTATHIDKEIGIVETIMKINNPLLVKSLLDSVGKNINLLGPLGHNIKIPKDKNILLIGEGFTNNTILSALDDIYQNNNKITYILSSSKDEKIFYEKILSSLAEQYIISTETIENILTNYLKTTQNNEINHVILSVMPHNLENIKKLLENSFLKDITVKVHIITSLFCGCKGICGACVTKLNTGEIVYSCANQEFFLKHINPSFDLDRLQQNVLIEQLANI